MSKTTRFGLALRAAGLTASQWIAQALDPPVSASHLYAVLRGERKSARIEAAIERLIRQQRSRIERAFRTRAA